jgi:NitT/TauT family transport system substrate-binding protein
MESDMKMTKKRLTLAGVVAALVGLSTQGSASTLEKVSVLQPIPNYDVRYAPWAIAQENGYFSQEGLDVELPLAKGSMVAIQQLVNGKGSYAQLPPDGVIIANSKGADLKFYYSFITKNPFPLAVEQDSPIKSLSDIKGKKVGVYSLSAVQFYTSQAILKSVGLVKDKDYQMIDVGSGASALAALQRGDVDVLAHDILIYSGFHNRGANFRFMSSPQIDKVFSWGLVTTGDNLKNNPNQAVALARGLTKGRIACAADTKRCIEVYFKRYPTAKPMGMDSATAVKEQEEILKQYIAYGPKPADGQWGSYAPDAWAAAMNYMVDAGLITAPVEESKMYTSALLPKINDFDAGSLIKNAP